MQSSTFKRSAVALAIVGAFAAGSVIAERAATIKPAGAATPVATTANAVTAPGAIVALPDFTQLVAQQGPAVVQITVTHEARQASMQGAPDMDETLKRLRAFSDARTRRPTSPWSRSRRPGCPP